jgi:hypothetical protein
MAKDPAFLFYSSDFLMGVMVLSMEQRGQYITILSLMHQHGRLTLEEIETALHCKVSENVLKKFKKDSENRFYNERLESEVKRRSEFSESRRNSLKIDNGDMVHLYIIKSPSENLFKIGSSKYPQLRLKEVQKYKPGSTFLWISTDLFERINEQTLHEKFKDKRHKYDWFLLSDEDLNYIISNFSKTSEVNRTEVRTETETVNVNRNKDVIDLNKKGVETFGEKTTLFVTVRAVYVGQKIKIIYSLQEYFQSTAQLESVIESGWTDFSGFIKSNPGAMYEDDNHLYHAFKKYSTNQKQVNGTRKKKSFAEYNQGKDL